jgi:hypothetical protein
MVLMVFLSIVCRNDLTHYVYRCDMYNSMGLHWRLAVSTDSQIGIRNRVSSRWGVRCNGLRYQLLIGPVDWGNIRIVCRYGKSV